MLLFGPQVQIEVLKHAGLEVLHTRTLRAHAAPGYSLDFSASVRIAEASAAQAALIRVALRELTL